MGGKSPDTSAQDAQTAELQAQYNQNQADIEQQRQQMEQTEIGYLRAQGGPQMVDASGATIAPPSNPTPPAPKQNAAPSLSAQTMNPNTQTTMGGIVKQSTAPATQNSNPITPPIADATIK